jgi:hypothetical protein
MAADGITSESTNDFLWEVHKYTNEYIRFADTKAAFVAGVSTALIGSLVESSLFDSAFCVAPCHWSKLQWVGILAIVLLALSIGLNIAAIRPRLWNNRTVGFIFWGSICGHETAHAFTHAVRGLTTDEMTKSLSEHLFILASIAKRKFEYVDRSIYAGVAGGVLASIVLFAKHATK